MTGVSADAGADPLAFAAAPVREWFTASFRSPTEAQVRGWPLIAAGRSVLILAPTGSGKIRALGRLCFFVALCPAPV